jgi:hypothetical protein
VLLVLPVFNVVKVLNANDGIITGLCCATKAVDHSALVLVLW